MSELRREMIREMELRDFAETTQKAYIEAVKGLAGYYWKPPGRITQKQVEDYLLHLKIEKSLSYNTRNQITSGLKIFLQQNLEESRCGIETSQKNRTKKTSGSFWNERSSETDRGTGQP